MADAGARRHHAEILKGLLAPAQEGIALVVAPHLDLDIGGKGARRAEIVHLHRMIDNEIDRHQRIDALGIAAESGHGIAHCGQVDHRRHAGEVLHQHPRGAIGDLATAALAACQGADIVDTDAAAIFEAQ